MAQLLDVLQKTTTDIFVQFSSVLPNVANAFVILIVGYILGKATSKIVELFFRHFFNIDIWLKRKRLHDAFFGFSFASIISGLVKWYIYLVFIIQALAMINLDIFSAVLNTLIFYTPKLFGVVFIFLFGALIGEWLKQQTLKAKIPYKRSTASFIKGVALYLFFVTALQNAGIDTTILVRVFEIFLLGLVLTFSLTLGISFGLAMKDDAKKWLRRMKRG